MKIDYTIILGLIFFGIGIFILFKNHRYSREATDFYVRKLSKDYKEMSYYALYIRGVIIGLMCILLGLYLLGVF